MASYWIPTYGHPRGTASEPWFVVDDDLGRRAEGHPKGPSQDPCLRVVDGAVWPVTAVSGEGPRFEIVGSFVYLAGASGPPWYRIHGLGEPSVAGTH